MKTRNTTRSDAIVAAFQNRELSLERRSYSFSGTWQATAEDVFPLLCPSREADWIPGWTARILYSSTGYAEDQCVFETDESCALGSGLWTFTAFEHDRLIAFVRFEDDTVTHASIPVVDNGDGTTTATWNVTVTALTKEGNEKVAAIPGADAHAAMLVGCIRHYLEEGEVARPTGSSAP